ncbi:MAG: DUF3821 domain-containing protein [Methanoregula sp.]|uniref:DUF3821 domain-containing protein n=1 Tax=Methanoregula sp. TaxID=2052170 RepID=UPI0025F7F6B2|nr:DUF3821 domain-containing protein [Methanoregula sp.]MCK9630347.1 DUF3821 domain-containing protein [Methanoregula sp.]
MHGKYILSALVVILLVCSPVAATTAKIAAGAPVFIGESNLNIASAIGDCHVIAWWPDQGNMTGPAVRNLTVKRLNEANDLVTRFNVSPQVFEGYTGNWYCEDKAPHFVVLTVLEPGISIKVWNIDTDEDITGQSVPFSTNITYRIDTNLNQALNYYNRTELTPADGFFTVKVTNPSGQAFTNIYTGSVGSADTQILSFDGNPFITTPTYFGQKMDSWNRLSRDASGSLMYPPGTYTFTVSQDLSHMQESYASTGKTTSSASVAFQPLPFLTSTPVTPILSQENVTVVPVTTQPPVTVIKSTVPTPVPVATKTTYSPLPAWIAIIGLGCAALIMARRMQ